jgi:hypothetical protein
MRNRNASKARHSHDESSRPGSPYEGLVALAFDCREHLARLADCYADRKPDLADLCPVRMSELFPKHAVITIDHTDFRVYRRNKREAIPIVCPPER